jgi:hypothetical protein
MTTFVTDNARYCLLRLDVRRKILSAKIGVQQGLGYGSGVFRKM